MILDYSKWDNVSVSDDSDGAPESHIKTTVPSQELDHREQSVLWALELEALELECQKYIDSSKRQGGSKN
jgi:hypothetical protein